jgi:aryl-alcohol dehydrogenase-like predicted oxidoreductase
VINKICIGTVQFGQDYGIANKSGKVKKSEAFKIINSARKNNINFLDTAVTYGESEKLLGDIGVSNFNVVTKLPSYPNNCYDPISWIRGHVKKSLKNMKLKSLYGLLLHRSDDFLRDSSLKIKEGLMQLKFEGLVKKIGVSIYHPNELKKIEKIIKPDLVQAPINLIDQRLVTSGWLQKLHDEGVEVHSRSSFLQGLLLMPRNQIPSKFNRWSKIWDCWEQTQKKHNMSALQLCLSYSLSLSRINKVIIGLDNNDHLNSVIKASKITSDLKDWSFINSDDPLLVNPYNWNKL